MLLIAYVCPTSAQAVCAKIKIEIVQDYTLERQAFDARLTVINETSEAIVNLLVGLNFFDDTGADQAALFYSSLESVEGIGGSGHPDGGGSLPAGGTAELSWLIIPSPGAGGDLEAGQLYGATATISFVQAGIPSSETMEPDYITVLPTPRSALDYFLTRYVIGDNGVVTVSRTDIRFPAQQRLSPLDVQRR